MADRNDPTRANTRSARERRRKKEALKEKEIRVCDRYTPDYVYDYTAAYNDDFFRATIFFW